MYVPFCYDAELPSATVTRNKKADAAEHVHVFNHVGLPANKPPGTAGLPSVWSPDNLYQFLTEPIQVLARPPLLPHSLYGSEQMKDSEM
jgi:hypothetical protein